MTLLEIRIMFLGVLSVALPMLGSLIALLTNHERAYELLLKSMLGIIVLWILVLTLMLFSLAW